MDRIAAGDVNTGAVATSLEISPVDLDGRPFLLYRPQLVPLASLTLPSKRNWLPFQQIALF